jgi:ketosteroid isomerase-like protein
MWSCTLMYASAIHARYMDTLTEDDRRQIEQIHSSWIEFEIAGASHNLMTLCADDIEFCPPDAQPVCGRAEVAAQFAHGARRVQSIEIGGCRIRGSKEIAYLTAHYKTTF